VSDELRDIPGFLGYAITKDGRVWSKPRKGRRGGIWLTPFPIRSGHLKVGLRKDGDRHWRCIHRLVLETYVGPCPDNMECRHLNGNPKDNRADNLTWGTQAENSKDAVRHGTHPGFLNRGEACGSHKLTEEQVRQIVDMYGTGLFTQREIGKQFGVHPSEISLIVNRKTWRHLWERVEE
jgi:hypothetical protein